MTQKYFFSVALFLLLIFGASTQNMTGENLKSLNRTIDDVEKVDLFAHLASGYQLSHPDSAILYAQQGLNLAKTIEYRKGEMECRLSLAFGSWASGDFATAIKLGSEVIVYASQQRDSLLLGEAYAAVVNGYRDQGEYEEALRLSQEILKISKKMSGCPDCGIQTASIGAIYLRLSKLDSAVYYLQKAFEYPEEGYDFSGWIHLMTGLTQEKLGLKVKAYNSYKQSIKSLLLSSNQKDLAGAYIALSGYYENENKADSSEYYANLGLEIANENNFLKEISEAHLALANLYESVNVGQSLANYKLAMATKDNIYNQDKQRQVLSFKLNEQLRQNEIKAAELASQNSIRINALLGTSFTFVLAASLLFLNSRQKQRDKKKIELAYTSLKTTQNQLIQSEKMASLGELTAGIAHEIQNPLNFVNNFSEINAELLDEMEEEIDNGDLEEVKAIAKDLRANEEKINHHGKRADAIVKGMLQHSRTSSGEKVQTDLNELADEYLRLAYHGLRAKDSTFNAAFDTYFDPDLPKIEVIPQDMGRVLFNLINNAFQAVDEKSKSDIDGYSPKVTVKTKLYLLPDRQAGSGGGEGRGQVQISIKDNGTGIPDDIKEKIFQPFFTTKPTGQGTGLGLSMAYDIVKAHGGELTVNSKEGEGSEFSIIIKEQ